MIQRIPILDSIGNLFGRRDPRQQVGLALTRLLTQFDMAALPYDEGVSESRRNANTRHFSLGIWLIPLDDDQNPQTADMSRAIPAATCDLRRNGIGVLTPVKLESRRYIVAVADLENVWRYFLSRVRHQSDRPGGWYQLGLSVERTWEPESQQSVCFRQRLESGFAHCR